MATKLDFNNLGLYIKSLGFKKVSLLVDLENPKALALYEKIGFKKNSILKVSNHDYHHMIKMI